jgi:predicted  nucleic acid-binding Zn-ribbon protein
MTMTQTTTSSGTADDRLVTIADLRYELERERQITLAHFARIDQRFIDLTASFDTRIRDLTASVDARFEQVDKRFEQVDKRFEQVDKRFDRIDARFDALDERLRSNKTLIILSISTAASIASVMISLLK